MSGLILPDRYSVTGKRPTSALGPMDAYHARLHLDPRGDPRTPIVNKETGDRSWQLRPDLILKGCIARGCRVKLYAYADGSTTDELETGGEP